MDFYRMLKPFTLISLSVLFFGLTRLNIHLAGLPERGYDWEEYDSTLVPKINSVSGLLSFVDSETSGLSRKSVKYTDALGNILRKRFYHGYSHYSLKENWLAALAGKFIWIHLSAIVDPEDLLKYPMAACSQQSIVLDACFKEIGLPYRKIGFNHHYATEAFIEGKWYFFDSNMEPQFPGNKRASVSELYKQGLFPVIYHNSIPSSKIEQSLGAPHFGEIDVHPAPRAAIFFYITSFLSKWLWIVPLLMLLSSFARKLSGKHIGLQPEADLFGSGDTQVKLQNP